MASHIHSKMLTNFLKISQRNCIFWVESLKVRDNSSTLPTPVCIGESCI